jgi:SAM-dependent MidA family methyltransferase
MDRPPFIVETQTPFSESLIWQLNRDYYQKEGINAWREGNVPHNLTSNALVGKTYAELILGFLKDRAAKGNLLEPVYFIELGAGHGRLAFHILKQLNDLVRLTDQALPPYCYILSDFVEDNLGFFRDHPSFQDWLEQGILDFTFFDALESHELTLGHSGKRIQTGDLKQPLVVIANYFFDSIPNDLFYLKNTNLSLSSIRLTSQSNPAKMDAADLLQQLDLSFHNASIELPFYQNDLLNSILKDYQDNLFDTYIFFPHKGLECLARLKRLSTEGLMLISMDKGFHEKHELENRAEPEIITHGSFSIWVNFHALSAFFNRQGGLSLFPAQPTFFMELGTWLLVPDSEKYLETQAAYRRFVINYSPDDLEAIKKFIYRNIDKINLQELIAMIRLNSYDSVFFTNILPRLKQLSQRITFRERSSLAIVMKEVANMYFSLHESFDLNYEIGGIFYDLGFYREALHSFNSSQEQFGLKPDIFYNKALCYYQLREDALFLEMRKKASLAFPDYEKLIHLDKLDLNAE